MADGTPLPIDIAGDVSDAGHRKGDIVATVNSQRRTLLIRGAAASSSLRLDVLAMGFLVLLVLVGATASGLGALGSASHNGAVAATTGDASPQSREPATVSRLSPSMALVLENVAQRYRVSPNALAPVFDAILEEGRMRRIDPLLVIAVISIESRFNPYSQSPLGAQGLMQVIPRFHQDKLPKPADPMALLDPVTNVRVGIRVLEEAIRRQGGLIEGLQHYGGALDDEDRSYSAKVLAEKQRLEQLPRRKDVVAS